MKIPPILLNSPAFALKKNSPFSTKNAAFNPQYNDSTDANPVYATIQTSNSIQISTIKKALDKLETVEFLPNDVIYMKNLGINLPFKNGREAVKWIEDTNAKISYANFSNPKVHACLDYDPVEGISIFINSNYKDNYTDADILAISEAILHECGHGKDMDDSNSIQEELNCMALNVLAHRFYQKKYPGIFDNHNSFLYKEGVSLYPKLFFEFTGIGLRNRIAQKYGYLHSGDNKHPATKLAVDIKDIYESATYV